MDECQKEQCTKCTWEPWLGTMCLSSFSWRCIKLIHFFWCVLFSLASQEPLCYSLQSWFTGTGATCIYHPKRVWAVDPTGIGNVWLGRISCMCMCVCIYLCMKMLKQSSKRTFLLSFCFEFRDLKVMRSLEKVWLRCRARNAPYPPEILELSWTDRK